MKICIDGQELAEPEFYIEQMKRLVEIRGTRDVNDAEFALPIMSFFCGQPVSKPKTMLFSGHIWIFLEDKYMQNYVSKDPQFFFDWVCTLFYYFSEMAAFPPIARSIWIICWNMLNMLSAPLRDDVTLSARCQMAGWAASYDKQFAEQSLMYIKKMKLTTRFKAYQSLFLSTTINKSQSDFIYHINNALALSKYLSPIHKLQAYIHYYCNVDTTSKFLNNIISALNWNELADYRLGKMGKLEAVIWAMQNKNNYEDLLFLQRCLKFDIRREDFQTSHAFLLPSLGDVFVALKKLEKISYPSRNNGESYFKLMQICNRLNGVVISLKGEENMEVSDEIDDFDDYGKPNRNGDFNDLKNEVITHYFLDNDFYKELNLVSLVPSHNHPIQGALCSLNVAPPTISTSLRDLPDESQERHFVFFLSSATYTHDVELNWIRSMFGNCAEIYTDPTSELLLDKIGDNQYTHIYISAHGQRDHWERSADHIHFSDNSIVSVDQLNVKRERSSKRRTLIINICDGAAARISFNINNGGIAATLASGDQVVVSHLWPVDPRYAAIFGLLMLDRLTFESANQAALNIYNLLDQPNLEISKAVDALGSHFSELAQMIANTEFEIRDFRNIGSLAIYG